jgi:hypothetical protein
MTLPGRFPILLGRVTNAAPVTLRFVDRLPDRAMAIAPLTFCFVQLPGDSDYHKCTLTRVPHLDAHDPAWKDLKDPPTLIIPNLPSK